MRRESLQSWVTRAVVSEPSRVVLSMQLKMDDSNRLSLCSMVSVAFDIDD